MFYFNDFPRFFQTFSGDRFEQNSCLHGGASIPSLYMEGNAMFPQFQTPKAALMKQKDGHMIYDYGACTVTQLLTGKDPRLDDPGYAVSVNVNESEHKNFNPCRKDEEYLKYSEAAFASPPAWDFVLINDNTRNPARYETRMRSLQFLEQFYLPMLQETDSTPVFLWTHAYGADALDAEHNMTGLEDVANFTSLTYTGYKAYVDLLKQHLPEEQQPRIAPVGMAFLTVYEERPSLWRTLFHCDHIHASPSGSFLQACVMYYTLFGEMPNEEFVVRDNMRSLWRNARMMQHAWEPPNPFPNRKTAAYLYNVAKRVVHGHVPTSFINYDNGEVAYEG